jgi:preprotein translocase subunit SecD
MQKNLKWKIIVIIVAMLACVAYIAGPKKKDAGLFSRINLGLDLQGGIHLVLQVVADEALNHELDQDALSIARELKSKTTAFESSKRGDGFSIKVSGVDSAGDKDARNYLEDTFGKEYDIVSRTSEGKTDITLSLRQSEIRTMRESTVRQALETVRRRVDEFGVSEPSLQLYGESGQDIQDQIIIELPGIDDPDRVKNLLDRTAQLKWCLVHKKYSSQFSSIESAVETIGKIPEGYQLLQYEDKERNSPSQFILVREDSVITGKDLKTARVSKDTNGAPEVQFNLTSDGADLFSKATSEHIGDRLAIVLDDRVYSAPTINSKINADGVITGSFTRQEADDLALLLRSGALPASLKILDERSVGASLGNDSIRSGLWALCVGFGLVVVFMIVYYKQSGVNAVWCLIANLVFLMAGMTALGASLTLPGIAGIILLIGMAVDSNILIFERIREELRSGKTVRAAIDTGFGKVFWTIFDTHLATLISAAFLFQFGTGPIRGFAVTLTFGLIANMFTAVYFSHRLFDMRIGGRKVEQLSI